MKTEETNKGSLENWTPQEVAEAFERDEIVLIDVRTPQEYSFERIDGALLAPMQAFQAVHMPGQSDKRIVFHCGSGVRSKKVAGNVPECRHRPDCSHGRRFRCLEGGRTDLHRH
jgi:predicted sulfurtransferase